MNKDDHWSDHGIVESCEQICFACRAAGLTVCPDAGGKLPLVEVPVYAGLTKAEIEKMDAFLRHPAWGER